MKVLIWIAEATWPACVDTTNELFPDADVHLVAVLPAGVSDHASAAHSRLWGRGNGRDPGAEMARIAHQASREMLVAAAERLGRPATTTLREGRIEREITSAAADADLLVLARDGDLSRLGPHSLDKHTRFVVDHAPCRVLLVWPGPAPELTSIPPPPR